MRGKEFKHENETRHSAVFVLSFLCAFLCAAALGTIRLYGLYLEHRISETSRKIEISKEENSALARTYSRLLSPSRIYNYARTNLGMTYAENVKVITLDEHSIQMARLKVDTTEKAAFAEGQQNPFVNRAHAKD